MGRIARTFLWIGVLTTLVVAGVIATTAYRGWKELRSWHTRETPVEVETGD